MMINVQVNINGKTGDLPWHRIKEDFNKALIKVKQATDDIIVLETFDGLKVKCDAYYHVCSIKLSGRFHGKTKGKKFSLLAVALIDNLTVFARFRFARNE